MFCHKLERFTLLIPGVSGILVTRPSEPVVLSRQKLDEIIQVAQEDLQLAVRNVHPIKELRKLHEKSGEMDSPVEVGGWSRHL